MIGDELRSHVEAYLGGKPSKILQDERIGVTAARFEDSPEPEMMTSITIGLSGHLLDQPTSGHSVRQELMFCTAGRYAALDWEELLLVTGRAVVDRHSALMLGEVLGPAGMLFSDTSWCTASALLCVPPAFYAEEFGDLLHEDGTTTIIVELIPITSSEAAWIRRHGWSRFFERVNRGDIDILNLARE